MGKYHVTVYAICKNEAGFARRWMESMGEADRVVVLDTGSDDGTPELLRSLGAQVTEEEIVPWRFDAARNRSLELVDGDTDICVCTDLDEVFVPGWRSALERAWSPEVQQARYRYIWNFRPDGADGVTFLRDRIHARRGFRWVRPVYEALQWEGGEPRTVFVPGLRLERHAGEAKARGAYLPLLELAVEEEPENGRSLYYLGREYLDQGRWVEAMKTLGRRLALPGASWEEERCASMRCIARCCRELGQPAEEERWLLRACSECPGLREPWVDLAGFCCRREDWHGVIYAARRALEITRRPENELAEPEAWSEAPYDLLAVALYYTGDYRRALAMGEEALKRSPMDRRLRENLRLIRQKTASQ